MFQSLLLWMWSGKNLWLYSDGALSNSFNPCYCGCGLGSEFLRSYIVKRKRFQSLLLWMWSGKFAASTSIVVPFMCFNPCYCGCGLGSNT